MIWYYITEGEIKNPVCISLPQTNQTPHLDLVLMESVSKYVIHLHLFLCALVILIKLDLCPTEQNVYEKISANVPQITNPPILLSFFVTVILINLFGVFMERINV